MAGVPSGDILVVDSNELRGLAGDARSQGARIKADEARAARIIASIDRTGWNAGAALGKWPGVRSGLDAMQADQTRAALDLERRATLVDIANSPDFSFFGGPIALGPLFHPFDLSDLPNAPVEWQRLLGALPPGWSQLTRQQRLALIDVVPFGALGYKPAAAPPPPPKPHHHSWFHNLVSGAEHDLGDAGNWVLKQGSDFGNTMWGAAKGTVDYADQWLKAILRTGINGTYELEHGLSDPLHTPPPPLQGPEINDMINRLPSDLFHSVIQPGVDLYHGRVGAAAADLILLVGFKGLKIPKVFTRVSAEDRAAALGGHGHERHGSQTTIDNHTDRVQNGTWPDPNNPHAVPQSTRFDSPQAELDAVNRAMAEAVKGDPQTGRIYVNSKGQAMPERQTITVTGRKGGYGSGVRLQKPNGQPLPGRPVEPTGQLPNARVIIEWDPATNTWKLVTQYPSEKTPGVQRPPKGNRP